MNNKKIQMYEKKMISVTHFQKPNQVKFKYIFVKVK